MALPWRSWLPSLAMPAAAADTKGTLAIVNGIPGKKVDVCLNGNEIKCSLALRRPVFQNVVGTGNKNLKFYERDPRTLPRSPGSGRRASRSTPARTSRSS